MPHFLRAAHNLVISAGSQFALSLLGAGPGVLGILHLSCIFWISWKYILGCYLICLVYFLVCCWYVFGMFLGYVFGVLAKSSLVGSWVGGWVKIIPL